MTRKARRTVDYKPRHCPICHKNFRAMPDKLWVWNQRIHDATSARRQRALGQQ
jgi:hypothetical protein